MVGENRLVKHCKPYEHQWSHASTVGYFRCSRCQERVEHTDPRYAALKGLQDDLFAQAKRTQGHSHE